MIVLCGEISRSNKDSNHNNIEDIINVTKAAARKPTLMRITKAKVANLFR
jgi:hypothetical protein